MNKIYTQMTTIGLLFLLQMTTIDCKTHKRVSTPLLAEWDFTVNLLSKLLPNTTKNLIISPISLRRGLALLRFGSSTSTTKELRETGKFGRINNIKLTTALAGAISKVKKLKNTGIVQSLEHSLNHEWLNHITKLFQYKQSDVEKFSPYDINQWVVLKSNRKIENFINPKDMQNDTSVFIADVLSFKGAWQIPFLDLSKAEKSRSSNYMKRILMYQQQNQYMYTELHTSGVNGAAVTIPFDDNATEMLVILPKEKTTVVELLKNLPKLDLRRVMSQLDMKNVKILIPQIQMHFKNTLDHGLMQLGIKESFTDAADFSLLTHKTNTKVSKIQNQVVLEISNEKFNAISATSIQMVDKDKGIRYNKAAVTTQAPDDLVRIWQRNAKASLAIDHPFVFFIITNNNILFAGTIDNVKNL